MENNCPKIDLSYLLEDRSTDLLEDNTSSETVSNEQTNTEILSMPLTGIDNLVVDNIMKKIINDNDYSELDVLFALSEENNIQAQYAIGYCYNKGLGVTADSQKFLEYTTKAANKGHQRACLGLGEAFLTGSQKGIVPNLSQAEYWINKAQLAEGYYWLGIAYEGNYGIIRDNNKSLSNYKKAAELKHKSAKERLGELYVTNLYTNSFSSNFYERILQRALYFNNYITKTIMGYENGFTFSYVTDEELGNLQLYNYTIDRQVEILSNQINNEGFNSIALKKIADETDIDIMKDMLGSYLATKQSANFFSRFLNNFKTRKLVKKYLVFMVTIKR